MILLWRIHYYLEQSGDLIYFWSALEKNEISGEKANSLERSGEKRNLWRESQISGAGIYL
jgi:hypothetical protein